MPIQADAVVTRVECEGCNFEPGIAALVFSYAHTEVILLPSCSVDFYTRPWNQYRWWDHLPSELAVVAYVGFCGESVELHQPTLALWVIGAYRILHWVSADVRPPLQPTQYRPCYVWCFGGRLQTQSDEVMQIEAGGDTEGWLHIYRVGVTSVGFARVDYPWGVIMSRPYLYDPLEVYYREGAGPVRQPGAVWAGTGIGLRHTDWRTTEHASDTRVFGLLTGGDSAQPPGADVNWGMYAGAVRDGTLALVPPHGLAIRLGGAWHKINLTGRLIPWI